MIHWSARLDEETVTYLEGVVANEPEWESGALCAQVGYAMFFTEDDMTPDEAMVHCNQARRVCALCPVRPQCLAASLMALDGAPIGIWAGMSEDQRRDLRRGGLPTIRKKIEELQAATGDQHERTSAA